MKSKKTKTTIDKWTDREVGKHRVVAITWPDIDDVPYFSMQCKRHNSSKWIDCDDLYVAVSRLVVLNLANKSMNEMLDCYYKQIEKLEEKLDKMTRKKEYSLIYYTL